MMCAAIDALEIYGGVPAPQEGEEKSFTDQGSISSWAVDSVARAARMGILQGDASGKFNPKGTLTWQEACVMVDRIYTSAEPVVKARRAQQGIQLMDTAFELDADKYIRQSSNRFYALENNGQKSVLFISSGGIKVESYNADGTSAGIRTISAEMKRCGGFCEGENNYYLAFGEDNMEENNGKTVYRVVKYDKNWNRMGAADISNCYTTKPFDFTSRTAMAEENGTLILHTSRQRYLTSDGLRLDVVGGNTVRLTGMKADDFGGRYNYVVLRAFGVQEDTPFTAGAVFSVSAKVNAAGLAAFYASEGKTSMLTALICQNYKPGASAMVCAGFSGADQIALIPDGNGGVAFRVTRR